VHGDVVDAEPLAEHDLPAVAAGPPYRDQVLGVVGSEPCPVRAHGQGSAFGGDVDRVRVDAGQVEVREVGGGATVLTSPSWWSDSLARVSTPSATQIMHRAPQI